MLREKLRLQFCHMIGNASSMGASGWSHSIGDVSFTFPARRPLPIKQYAVKTGPA